MKTNLQQMESIVLRKWGHVVNELGKPTKIEDEQFDDGKRYIYYKYFPKVVDAEEAYNEFGEACGSEICIYISGTLYGIGTDEEEAFLSMVEDDVDKELDEELL